MHWCADINALQRPLLQTSASWWKQRWPFPPHPHISCVSDRRLLVVSALLYVCLFELKAAGGKEDVKEDKIWLHIWPPPPLSAPSHPSHLCITASCNCRHQIKPLYDPSRTETGKLPPEPTAELFASSGGGAQFAATKATWNLFLSTKGEKRTELWCQ